MLNNYLAKTLVLAVAFTLAPPVFAYSRVKDLEISDDERSVPTLEVFQEVVNDKLVYTKLKGGIIVPDRDPEQHYVNLRVKVEAQCRWGYLLSRTLVDTANWLRQRPSSGELGLPAPYSPVISTDQVEQEIAFTAGNRTLGARIVDFLVPLENFQPLIAYGNEQVAARAGSIIEENAIRANDWTTSLRQPTSLRVRCKRSIGYTGLDKWWASDTFNKQVRVVYRGASAEFDLANPAPGQGVYFDPTLPNGQLGNPVDVNANLLIVTNDQTNDCMLDLSGTFTTSGKTTIFYYLVDDRGVMSPLYKVAVDQTMEPFVAFVYHPVDLSEREPEGPFPATDRGFSALPTDRLQGFYQIEVVSPHKTTSNIAEYNIEPCNSRPDTIQSVVANPTTDCNNK